MRIIVSAYTAHINLVIQIMFALAGGSGTGTDARLGWRELVRWGLKFVQSLCGLD